jgi:hypothetical protein
MDNAELIEQENNVVEDKKPASMSLFSMPEPVQPGT